MTEQPRVELYLRSLAPVTARDQQNEVVTQLQELDSNGCIRGFDIILCGDCVCPESATARTQPAKRLLERYEQFQAWATKKGRTLVGFEERDSSGLLTGTSVTGIVFPRITLAEFRGGSLSFVAPSATEETQTTVRDRLTTYGSLTAE